MKKILFALSILSLFIFSCSNAEDPKVKIEAEALKAEIITLDSLSADIDATIEDILKSRVELEEALEGMTE